jgi:hypothetical protein
VGHLTHLKSLNLEQYHLACQVFLLKNTNFITSQLGVERLLCEYDVPEAYTKSLQFFAMSADSAFDITETTAVFCHIMRNCKIDDSELEKQIQFVHLREEELSTSFRMKQIRMIGGRPRLRSKLTDIQREARSVFAMAAHDYRLTLAAIREKGGGLPPAEAIAALGPNAWGEAATSQLCQRAGHDILRESAGAAAAMASCAWPARIMAPASLAAVQFRGCGRPPAPWPAADPSCSRIPSTN